MRHEILSVTKAKARLLELTRAVQEDGKAYILTRDGEPVSALVPIADYESLLETLEIHADAETISNLNAALARISHKVSTTAAQRAMSTTLRSLRLLDIRSSMPAGSSVARLVSTALCTASLRNPVRNAGLTTNGAGGCSSGIKTANG